MYQRMKFIIKTEHDPKLPSGKLYRAYFENGHSAYISALTEADLILKLKDFYRIVEILSKPDLAKG